MFIGDFYMMYCSKCKAEASDASKFCALCGGALESGAHTSNDSPGGLTENQASQNGLLSAFLAENNTVALVNIFFWVSIFDIGLTYVYNHFEIIPNLYKTDIPHIYEAVFSLVILGAFYLAFRFWGVAKSSKIPFFVYLVWCAFVVYVAFFLPPVTIVQEFNLYIRSPHTMGLMPLVSFYEHFISGLGLQVLVVLRILFLLSKPSVQK